jgi:hypothetical protein
MSPLTLFVWSLASLAAVAALGLLWLAVKSRDFDAPTPVDFELDDDLEDVEDIQVWRVEDIRLWRRKADAFDLIALGRVWVETRFKDEGRSVSMGPHIGSQRMVRTPDEALEAVDWASRSREEVPS